MPGPLHAATSDPDPALRLDALLPSEMAKRAETVRLRQRVSAAPREVAREAWSSRAGFVLTSIGSAVGIGNLWRFPYVAGTSVGGAFPLPYLVAVGL